MVADNGLTEHQFGVECEYHALDYEEHQLDSSEVPLESEKKKNHWGHDQFDENDGHQNDIDSVEDTDLIMFTQIYSTIRVDIMRPETVIKRGW